MLRYRFTKDSGHLQSLGDLAAVLPASLSCRQHHTVSVFVEKFNAFVAGVPANHVSAVTVKHYLSAGFLYKHHKLTGDGELAWYIKRAAEVFCCHTPGESPGSVQVSMRPWCAALFFLYYQRDEAELGGR